MTTLPRIRLSALALCLSVALPSGALAQGRPVAIPDSMGTQDREMLSLALELSKRCSETMEKWVSGREVSEERLFSFLYFPMPKTDPPKFTTDWDRLSDRDILPMEDATLNRSASLAFAVLVDKFGYLPTHNSRYAQPLTGNGAMDLVNNRTKRIFNDRVGLLAARSTAPYLLQRYQRDTGEEMVDISVPVYVKGKHWGAVRLGYRPS